MQAFVTFSGVLYALIPPVQVPSTALYSPVKGLIWPFVVLQGAGALYSLRPPVHVPCDIALHKPVKRPTSRLRVLSENQTEHETHCLLTSGASGSFPKHICDVFEMSPDSLKDFDEVSTRKTFTTYHCSSESCGSRRSRQENT